ncbi:hypothetical protein Pmani_016842 [Petrolisthes manimaculis]|uniref:Uncharacterized protein n=1 Tax=Petrolisthes manimaculis TaxID=1843537 RepID=A0AAE1NH64_9EUCA|nr:hypothetical protein Pmani_037761 [Petrolisthes manimaculis]KAK4311682.1 hypothetical protein Pmani_016842 [Petrolisthes manimaculis]
MPIRRPPRRSPGRSNKQNWNDRVRENSVVRTFGPLSGPFNLNIPNVVVPNASQEEQGRSMTRQQLLSVQGHQQQDKDNIEPHTSSLSQVAWAIRLINAINDQKLTTRINVSDLAETFALALPSRYKDQSTQTLDFSNTEATKSIYDRILIPSPNSETSGISTTHTSTNPDQDMIRSDDTVGIQVSEPPRSEAYRTERDNDGDDNKEQRSSNDPIYYVVMPHMEELRASTQNKSQDALCDGGATAEVQIDGGAGVSLDMEGEQQQQQQQEGGGRVGGGRVVPERVEVSSVSYLSVPETYSRRPSTADRVIEKLQVEKVEGGGLSIQGVALASNCHVTLCVFGVFFMLAGVILSYVSYNASVKARMGDEDSPKGSTEAMSSVSQMRMIGPSFLVLGLLMLGLGISLFVLAKKISRDEKMKQMVISEQQLFQLENSFCYANTMTTPLHTTAPAPHQQYPILAVRRNSWWMDPSLQDYSSPVVDARDSSVQCPSPIGEVVGDTPPRPLTPSPLDLLPDHSGPSADIACFPAAPNPEPVGDLVTLLPVADQDQVTPPRPPLSLPMLVPEPHPSSSMSSDLRPSTSKSPTGAQGRRSPVLMPFSNTQIPSIQVTAAPPVGPVLPRLSRHHSSHMDSRPTTADSR